MRIADYLLANHAVALRRDAADWRDAIAQGVALLERTGAVEPRYLDAIYANVAAHGPYFVLVPGFAMPHARPEDGARAIGFSLVTLRTPVPFGHPEHDPVSVVLCIAAPDGRLMNEEVILQVMQLLDADGFLERLAAADSEDDVRRLFGELPEES